MPSCSFIIQDKAKGSKAQKDRATLIMRQKNMSFMIKPGLICKLKNPGAQKKECTARLLDLQR